MLLVRSLERFAGGALLLFLIMTVVAIGMKVTGNLPWTTLGVWFLLDVGALAARRVLITIERRMAPRSAPKVS